METRRRLGLVLGAGAARGWAHIGVLQVLGELGIRPHIVCGTSSGSLVAASYATGRLDALHERVRSMTLTDVMRRLDINLSGGGLLAGRGMLALFREAIEDVAIESVSPTFGAVATDLESGREMWLTSGSIIDSVRASVSLPGLVVPFSIRGRWLVDGALVNPVPVSLCRALGADIIIGVTLNGGLFTPAGRMPIPNKIDAEGEAGHSRWLRWPTLGFPASWNPWSGPAPALPQPSEPARPSYLEVMSKSFFTMQDFVSRVRLAADPVDVLIAPRVGDIGLLDFHRGTDGIRAGRAAAEAAHEQLMEAWQACMQPPAAPASDQGVGLA